MNTERCKLRKTRSVREDLRRRRSALSVGEERARWQKQERTCLSREFMPSVSDSMDPCKARGGRKQKVTQYTLINPGG